MKTDNNKDIQLAIHDRPGSFSDRWIQFCEEEGISFKIIDCFASDILHQTRDFDGLLWHWHHFDPKAQLMARQLIASLEVSSMRVFPSLATCWHFDDKIGQKYLLESIGAPLVPTHVFFDEATAMKWIDRTEFPKVFKLRCGAGSLNVKLVKTKGEAINLCTKAFHKGFNSVAGYMTDGMTKIRKGKKAGDWVGKLKRLPAQIKSISTMNALLPKQMGYVYFQDFMPGNNFDIRITVIGNRAFGFTRNTRPNDFRASGSGDIIYDADRIDKRCVQIAFDIAKNLAAQSIAFDFLFDQDKKPRINEISYCYMSRFVYNCPGHWDNNLNWKKGNVQPEDAILMDLIHEINAKTKT